MFEGGEDRVVVGAQVRANDALKDLAGQHRAVGAEVHHAGQGEAVLFGVEAADAVGEARRQHRQDAVDEVDRVAALEGLLVEGAALRHVVADVGDVHPEAQLPVGQGFDRDRVVEVAGVEPVDGEGAQVAQVAAALGQFDGDQGVVERLGQALGGAADLGRKALAQAVGADDAEDRDIGAAGVAEHLDDAAQGRDALGRRRQLCDDQHAKGGAAELGGRDQQIADSIFARRYDVAIIALFAQDTGVLCHLWDSFK